MKLNCKTGNLTICSTNAKTTKIPENAQKCSKGNIEEPLSKIEEGSYRDRKLVFTSFDDDEPYHNFESDEIDENQIKFLIYGREKCPKTGKNHFQGFVYFYDKASIKKAKKTLKIKDGWFQYAFSTIKNNVEYCSKEGDFKQFGTLPQQGKRKDLAELRDDIVNGTATVDEIALTRPMMYHQYGRTLSKIETIQLRMKYRKWMTQGIWYYGSTGVGKSHKAFEGYDPKTHYIVNMGQLSRNFWTGYTGQETVIINEFRGGMPFAELLNLVDKWPLTLDVKCGEPVPFLAKTVIITSPTHPDDTYSGIMEKDGHLDQLHRRFKIIELKGLDAHLVSK